MPIAGGAADKLGNRYEALWEIDRLLEVVDGRAVSLTLEPIDPDESQGIEFQVSMLGGTNEYWSVKRQVAGSAGWTLHKLAAEQGGRSILRDLHGHIAQEDTNRSVFASAVAAPTLTELIDHAADQQVFEGRLKQSQSLKGDFEKYVMPLCGSDLVRALAFLRRMEIRNIDERQLAERIEVVIRKLFCRADGTAVDPTAIRGLLAELLLTRLHQPIDRQVILGSLEEHGIVLRILANDATVNDRITLLCNNYVDPIVSELINGDFLDLPSDGSILDTNGFPLHRQTLVVGTAGGGKSCTLAATVSELRAAGVPVLALRLDQLSEGIITTTELGTKLGLPESPAIVLAGVAQGQPCVLVVDQLDAVSMVSGRRVELWPVFATLAREASQYPNMSLLVGCREFDIEHDHRLRTLKRDGSGFATVRLKVLTSEQIDSAIKALDGAVPSITTTLKAVLATPLHLSMFLSLSPASRSAVASQDELFDHFWDEKRRQTDARLGRAGQWTNVLDVLARWLSENQELSAPKYILDDYAADAEAMVSEHVLVVSESSRYRFFHESFFDYTFARRFAAAAGDGIIALLSSGEQHLFRRAQIRQVLTFLRSHNWSRYLVELENILISTSVRFHIKRLVLQLLSAVNSPRREEWHILERFLQAYPSLRSHGLLVVAGHQGWFDVLDAEGFFDTSLSGDDEHRINEVIWMFGLHDTLETRSARVAELLRRYRDSTDTWKNGLRHICRIGEVYHSREMFDLFLLLINDGTLDGLRPGVAINDDWWMVLYSMAKDRPEYACEALGHWFDRVVALWNRADDHDRIQDLFGRGQSGEDVILQAASGAPLLFAQQMLPRMVNLASSLAKHHDDSLDIDPIWTFRHYGDDPMGPSDALLVAIAQALERLAVEKPDDLDQLIDPYEERPLDMIAYLLLRAWTAAPGRYADRLAKYFANDPRRLKIGYACWDAGGGSASIHVSKEAVRVSTAHCSEASYSELEAAILAMKDKAEAQRPRFRGLMQLELLESVSDNRRSEVAQRRLGELRRKFPSHEMAPPKAGGASFVGSPIEEDAQARMSDEQWLRAMHKYAGVVHRNGLPTKRSGGERELGHALESQAKMNPARFIALAQRMPDDLPSHYFDAIVRGVSSSLSENGETDWPIPIEEVVSLLRRVHDLPNRPSGQWIAYLIEKLGGGDWPDEVLDVIAWYALHDPDPEVNGRSYDDPYTAGLNSTRGAAAGAIASLLFRKRERFEHLREAVYGVVHDRSIAVRACAVKCLLALLDLYRTLAIEWFLESVAGGDELLKSHYVERFLRYAAYHEYPALQPLFSRMLNSDDDKIVSIAAREICLAAFDVAQAIPDAESIRSGSQPMREAAAGVYAANVAHESVAAESRIYLMPCFADHDASVRKAAAAAFRRISDLSTQAQAQLLRALLDAEPDPDVLGIAVRVIEDSPVQLPDLVCRLAEQTISAFQDEGGDVPKGGAMVAHDLSKIVIRLYAQTDDPAIEARCLDLIDQMELHRFYGVSRELQLLDR